jgi:hypothetical protein
MNSSLLLLCSIVILITTAVSTSLSSASLTTSTCTDSTTGESGIIDPYSGECLTVTNPDSIITPCSESVSASLCNGCTTCAIPPNCNSCMNTQHDGSTNSSNNGNGCPEGKATEYPSNTYASCTSVDPVYLREVLLKELKSPTTTATMQIIGIKDSTSIDILLSSGITTPTSPVQVNSPEFFRQKTSRDEMLLFSSDTNNDSNKNSNNLVVAMYWIPPVSLSILGMFVLHFLIVKS